MQLHKQLFIVLSVFGFSFSASAAETGRETGLPIPRFVSLKSSEINMRKGPGTRYPIVWVYRRDSLPVEIIEEFEHWRQIRDMDGATGWLHKNMLSGTRTVVVLGQETLSMMDDPEKDANPVAKIEPGVVATLKECEVEWCKIEVQKQKGWIRKKSLYGVNDKELYNP